MWQGSKHVIILDVADKNCLPFSPIYTIKSRQETAGS